MSNLNMHKIATYSLLVLVGMMLASFAAYYVLTEFVYAPEREDRAVHQEESADATSQEQYTGVTPITTPEAGEKALERGLMFVGEIKDVDAGCMQGMECWIMVESRKVVAPVQNSEGVVGKIEGVAEFVELEASVGKLVEIYAQELDEKTYTIYGSEEFYIKLLP